MCRCRNQFIHICVHEDYSFETQAVIDPSFLSVRGVWIELHINCQLTHLRHLDMPNCSTPLAPPTKKPMICNNRVPCCTYVLLQTTQYAEGNIATLFTYIYRQKQLIKRSVSSDDTFQDTTNVSLNSWWCPLLAKFRDNLTSGHQSHPRFDRTLAIDIICKEVRQKISVPSQNAVKSTAKVGQHFLSLCTSGANAFLRILPEKMVAPLILVPRYSAHRLGN